MKKESVIEIGTIWAPVKLYDPSDPIQKALDELGEIRNIQLRYLHCNVLSVTPLQEQVHPLSGLISSDCITYTPLEIRVHSAEKVEVVKFNLHPKYKASLVHKLPIQEGDDAKILLPYFIKVSGSEEFGSEALELEKKIGESYCKVESMTDYKLPKNYRLCQKHFLND
ncbi:MAG: hypothetical protein AABX24_05625 [Nanoarchaeota archaeon]|mgnify:CR=1 FL=1